MFTEIISENCINCCYSCCFCWCPHNCPRGKMPPDDCPLNNYPLDDCPPIIVLRIITPRIIAPEENWSPDNLPPRIIAPWMIAPGLLLPDNHPKDNCPLTIYLWKLPPRKIAFPMICRLHNCHSDKCSRGELPPKKIVPRINYTDMFFLQESETLLL